MKLVFRGLACFFLEVLAEVSGGGGELYVRPVEGWAPERKYWGCGCK